MRFYVSRFPKAVGGRGGDAQYFRVATLNIPDLQRLHTRLIHVPGPKHRSRIYLPPKGNGILEYKKTPHLLITQDLLAEATKFGGTRVPIEYIHVLCWILKKEYFASFSGVGMTEEAAKKFDAEIRAKRNMLLMSGEWIDEPSDPEIQFLNTLVKNIDLGRRSALNYSSVQSEEAFFEKAKFSKKTSHLHEEPTEEIVTEATQSEAEPEDVEIPASASSFQNWKKKKGLE